MSKKSEICRSQKLWLIPITPCYIFNGVYFWNIRRHDATYVFVIASSLKKETIRFNLLWGFETFTDKHMWAFQMKYNSAG